MNHDGEIIEVPLGVEFYASTYNLPLTSTSHVDNSINTSFKIMGFVGKKLRFLET
jgi:hypothetical protein